MRNLETAFVGLRPRVHRVGGKGNYGAFIVELDETHRAMVIAADGEETGWEHVSVHERYRKNSGKWKQRIPSWEIMCIVKDLFFESDECVIQFHPKEEDYIDTTPYVLHLWRKEGEEFPMPPKICV